MFAAIGILEIAIALVLGLIMLIALAVEKEGFATLVAIVAIALLTWLLWDPVKGFAAQPGAAMTALKWAGIYFVAGLVFSVFKWVFYSRAKAKEFNAEYFKWKADNQREIERRTSELNKATVKRSEAEAQFNAAERDSEPPASVGAVRALTLRELQREVEQAEQKLDCARGEKFISIGKRYGAIEVTEEARGTFTTKIDMSRLSGQVAAWTTYWPLYAALLIIDDFLRAVFDALTAYFKRLFQAITNWAFRV